MHKILILKAFEKAKLEREKKGDNQPSKVHMAEDISEFIESSEGFRLSERSYRDYRREAENLIDKEGDINIKQLKVINGLCKYLVFDNYISFKLSTSILKAVEKETNKINKVDSKKGLLEFFKRKSTVLSIGFIAVILIIILLSNIFNKQRWMVWNKDHYIEVEFDTEKYSLNELKLYKEERIKHFQKVEATCEVEYFDKFGKPKIWYGKNSKGNLEIFTSIGIHPETGKTLKEITKYMIKKYCCKSYK